MKLLNNPWLVGALCVVAAALAAYQVLPRHSRAGASPAPAPKPVAARPSSLAPRPSAAPAQTLVLSSLIDRGYVESHLAQWIESPQRDPFLLPTAAEHGAGTNSPVSQWKLSSIWRQTGSSLAVINNHIYAEGDHVGAYTLQTIESDGVWLQGPTGREGLGFPPPGAAAKGATAPPH